MPNALDTKDLEAQVKDMYRHVAEQPDADYHFELGRSLAERLGYPSADLDRIPAAAGETVVDLGSGSGMDSFLAANAVGVRGGVVGVDFTAQQLSKSGNLAAEHGFDQVNFREGRIEELPVESGSADCVVSNGVINLSPQKDRVFGEAARVLRPGGRLAIADIVSEQQLKESIVCDASLWASCIGGAAQEDAYREAIEAAGLRIEDIKRNPYEFISDRARDASAKYGVKSVSLLAIKAGE